MKCVGQGMWSHIRGSHARIIWKVCKQESECRLVWWNRLRGSHGQSAFEKTCCVIRLQGYNTRGNLRTRCKIRILLSGVIWHGCMTDDSGDLHATCYRDQVEDSYDGLMWQNISMKSCDSWQDHMTDSYDRFFQPPTSDRVIWQTHMTNYFGWITWQAHLTDSYDRLFWVGSHGRLIW